MWFCALFKLLVFTFLLLCRGDQSRDLDRDEVATKVQLLCECMESAGHYGKRFVWTLWRWRDIVRQLLTIVALLFFRPLGNVCDQQEHCASHRP